LFSFYFCSNNVYSQREKRNLPIPADYWEYVDVPVGQNHLHISRINMSEYQTYLKFKEEEIKERKERVDYEIARRDTITARNQRVIERKKAKLLADSLAIQKVAEENFIKKAAKEAADEIGRKYAANQATKIAAQKAAEEAARVATVKIAAQKAALRARQQQENNDDDDDGGGFPWEALILF